MDTPEELEERQLDKDAAFEKGRRFFVDRWHPDLVPDDHNPYSSPPLRLFWLQGFEYAKGKSSNG